MPTPEGVCAGRATATGVNWRALCGCALYPPEGAGAFVSAPEVGRWVKVLPGRTLGGDPTSYPALRGGHTVCSMGPLISRRAQFRGQRQHNDLFGSAARDLEGWVGVCQAA